MKLTPTEIICVPKTSILLRLILARALELVAMQPAEYCSIYLCNQARQAAGFYWPSSSLDLQDFPVLAKLLGRIKQDINGHPIFEMRISSSLGFCVSTNTANLIRIDYLRHLIDDYEWMGD